MSTASLFVRKASGLVRAWSVFDAFIYATFSINLVTLGLFIFSYCWYVGGSLISGIVIGAIFTIFEVVVYASLISAMPRAGGDYVWQSRILNRGLGFVLSITGWWFILWLWTPLYGQILNYEVFTPLLATAGLKDAALWFTTDPGYFTGSIMVCLLVFLYIALGMRTYARIQKFCFWGGLVGLGIVFLLLLFGNNASFVQAFNAAAPTYGAQAGDAYQATIDAGVAAGSAFGSPWPLAIIASLVLVPMLTFFNLWPNWGSTLYGEVRGASDYKRNLWGMVAAILVTTVGAVIFLALIAKTMGWDFYQNANAAFWGHFFYPADIAAAPMPVWPYPGLLASFLVASPAIRFVVVLLMSLWWFGWSGTLFLSSTRVIFAASIDRMLPEWVSKIEPRTKTPFNALLLMVVPALIISYLYAFNVFNMKTLALDATVVIAITFFGTTIAGTIMPWRAKDVFDGSPIGKLRVPKWLTWIAMLLYAAAAVFLIYRSFLYATRILGGIGAYGPDGLTWFVLGLLAVVTVINAGILLWILSYVGRRILKGEAMPVVTLAGLVFLSFLDWLLIEWFWDPNVLPGAPDPYYATYAIGWTNASSMIFMLLNYVVAAAIYFGFSAYRRRQGIDVDKIYKEIPVE
jgi:amino acid transporter